MLVGIDVDRCRYDDGGGDDGRRYLIRTRAIMYNRSTMFSEFVCTTIYVQAVVQHLLSFQIMYIILFLLY